MTCAQVINSHKKFFKSALGSPHLSSNNFGLLYWGVTFWSCAWAEIINQVEMQQIVPTWVNTVIFFCALIQQAGCSKKFHNKCSETKTFRRMGRNTLLTLFNQALTSTLSMMRTHSDFSLFSHCRARCTPRAPGKSQTLKPIFGYPLPACLSIRYLTHAAGCLRMLMLRWCHTGSCSVNTICRQGKRVCVNILDEDLRMVFISESGNWFPID